jgi:hypothetical protein
VTSDSYTLKSRSAKPRSVGDNCQLDGESPHREIGDSVDKRFGAFRLANLRTPIRDKAVVTNQRSYGAKPIAGGYRENRRIASRGIARLGNTGISAS